MTFLLPRAPQNNEELFWTVRAMWGVTIPRHTCGDPEHTAPFDAFADAYFERGDYSSVLWQGSRGFSGKSYLLSILGITKAFLRGADVNILGGSLAQSTNIHEHMRNAMYNKNSPRYMIETEGNYLIKLTNGARIRPLTASQKTIRGPHIPLLILDEIDEMDQEILDGALGQPMEQTNYLGETLKPFAVLCSTHQHPDGTMTEMKRRWEKRGQPIVSWCMYCTSNPIDGWLKPEDIEQKKYDIPSAMWDCEYILNEPSIGNRAFDSAAVEHVFNNPLNPIEGKIQKDYEEYTFEKPVKQGMYIAAADWGKEQDYTVISVMRSDVQPARLVYWLKVNRRPYPQMIGWFNAAINRYDAMAIHDGTGLGNVVNDYVDLRAQSFVMTGQIRDNMLSEYISAVENGRVAYPKIKSAYLATKYCISEGSLVRTLSGSKPIEKLKVGEFTLTRKGWRRITAVMNNGVRRVNRLRLSDGKELFLTEDHSVATLDGWVEAQFLKVGDVCFVSSTSPTTSGGTGIIESHNEIISAIGMPIRTLSGSCVSNSYTDAPVDVLSLRDRLKMFWVNTISNSTKMIYVKFSRYLTDKSFIRSSVRDSRICSSLPVTQFAYSTLPSPTVILVNSDSSENVVLVDNLSSSDSHTVVTSPLGIPTNVSSTVDTSLLDSNFVSAHVIECTTTNEQRNVWDIEVEGEHEFFANGILVHNCRVGDIYGRGKDFHLPDEVCSLALAWRLIKRHGFPGGSAITIARDMSPTRTEAHFLPESARKPEPNNKSISVELKYSPDEISFLV